MLPESLDKLCEILFAGCNFREIEIPDTVEQIDTEVFSQCYRLEHIVLPRHLKCLEQHAFKRCESLRSVVIGEEKEDLPIEMKGC